MTQTETHFSEHVKILFINKILLKTSTLCGTDLVAFILPVKLPKSIQLLDPPSFVEATFPLAELLTILAPF